MKQNFFRLLSLVCVWGMFWGADSATAQVTPDGTTNTTVNADGNNVTIADGDRAGSNLFHSFRDFSVPNGGSAFFNNNADIANIFSRVTGGNISNINGLLRANDANLFLINPAGIIFGAGARLDLGGGSFYGSSADSILFEDGEFSATDLENPPLITINAPIGLNLRDNPQPIINRSTFNDVGLEVNTGEKITLVGGNIDFEGGQIFAPGGRVELGGLSAAGTITFNDNGSLSFPDGVARSDVSLGSGAAVDVRAGGGGFITVNARNLELLEESNLFAGIGDGLGEDGVVAGDLNIFATGEIIARQDSSIQNRIDDNGIGDGGDINIETSSLTLTDGSLVSSGLGVNGNGDVGNIVINATDSISASGEDSEGNSGGIVSGLNAEAVGNSGNINLQARSLSLTNNAVIFTVVNPSGAGNTGDININIAEDLEILNSNGEALGSRIVTVGRQGNTGDIVIEAGGAIDVLDNAAIANIIAEGEGNVGELTIIANGDITFSSSSLLSSGQVAGNITLQSGGQIAIQSDLGKNSIIGINRIPDIPEPSELKQSGDINITAVSLVLEGEGLTGINNGVSGRNIDPGDINLNVQERIKIDGEGSSIGSSSQDNELGVNGDVNIETSLLTIQNGGALTSITNLGEINRGIQGGDINISVDSLSIINSGGIVSSASGIDVEPGDINIQVRDATVIEAPQNSDSSETPSSIPLIGSILLEDSTGRSGNIFLETGSLTIKDGGQIASASGGRGDGGNIRIQVADKIRLEGIANTNLEFNEQDILGFNLSANAIPSGIASSALSQQGGNGGNIEIAAGSLEIFEGAQILSTALGEGNAGNIDLNIRGDITLSGTTPIILNDVPGNSSSVIQSFLGLSNLAGTGETSGNTGNITIEANSLSLSDTAAISNTTFTRGNAGKIVLQIDDTISLSQGSFIDSSISPGGSGEGGDIEIQTRTLSLTDGSTLFAGLTGELFGLPAARGRGGNITIQASDSITISGFNPNTVTGTNFLNPSQSEIVEAGLNSSGIFVGTSEGTTGNPGTITLTTGDLRLADGGIIQASTGNNSIAGDITINADSFEALNGGQILAVTESSGNGGNINLSIAEELKISGSDSSFAERIAQFPDNVINQGAESAILALATAEATGSGGNISISSGELNILDNGRITVDSKGQGNGGTVSITADDLTLDGEAFISASTTAGAGGEISLIVDDSLILRNNSQITAQAFGTADGGNINIDTNFIVAFPSQNDGNDILASAERGRGGNININAESLFGIEERSLNPFSNDINASSEVFGLEGTVTINSPDLNPIQGASELPSNVVESRQTTAQACQTNREVANKNELVIKGKGGIPDAPDLPLNSHNIFINGEHANPLSATPQPILTSIGKIQPARGIKVTKDGRIILTAYPTNNQGERLPQGSINCGQV